MCPFRWDVLYGNKTRKKRKECNEKGAKEVTLRILLNFLNKQITAKSYCVLKKKRACLFHFFNNMIFINHEKQCHLNAFYLNLFDFIPATSGFSKTPVKVV